MGRACPGVTRRSEPTGGSRHGRRRFSTNARRTDHPLAQGCRGEILVSREVSRFRSYRQPPVDQSESVLGSDTFDDLIHGPPSGKHRDGQVLSNALFTHRTFRSGARSVARRSLDGVGRQLAPGPCARAGPSVNRRGMTSQTGFSPAQPCRGEHRGTSQCSVASITTIQGPHETARSPRVSRGSMK